MKLKPLLEKSLVIEETFEIACFAVLFVTIVIQILFRIKPVAEAFSYSPIWTEELSRWLYVYIVLIGAGVGLQRNEHIAIEYFADKLPPRGRLALRLLINALILFCCALFVRYGIKNVRVVWRQRSHTMPIFTYAVLYAVVPISFSLMILRTLAASAVSVADFFAKRNAEER